MLDYLGELFSSNGFMPHGHCYLWTPGIVWLHVISDGMIALAYYSIPLTLAWFVRRRSDIDFRWMFVCFAVFILACGTTHVMEIWNVWHANYWLSGGVKALTAAVSVPTAILLTRLMPKALALPSPAALARANTALEEEVRRRWRAQEELHQLNAELERRVADRMADLDAANAELRRQIAERKRQDEALRGSELDFRASFYSSAVGQAQVEPETGRYLRANPKFCEITGYAEEELLQMSFSDLTHPEDRVNDTAAHDRMVAGETEEVNREKRYRRKDGVAVWVAINASLIRAEDGRPLRTLAVVQDITARKEAEEARRAAEEKFLELNAELEQRVRLRTLELESANKELEAFSYSVSHDLRAPLRAMDGFSEALLDDCGPVLSERSRRYLERIRAGAQRMGVLIDDLLTFSRLSRLPLSKRPVDTGSLVREVLEDLGPQREGRRVELHCGELPFCHGDPALLRQIWINLLSNALKYTRKRETAVIEIGCESDRGEHVYFVRDNGTGFDMRYADKVFAVFQRLHRAEDYEGTGVGLAIVQRVIQRHGGRVWAAAEEGRGATFYFTIDTENEP